MKRKILVFCLLGSLTFLAGWPGLGSAQTPLPDIKAHGLDTPINLIPPQDLLLTLSLDAGGLTDPGDWWLVVVWPGGIVSLAPDGWKPGLVPAYTGPLFNVPPINLNIPGVMVLPMTPYWIFLGVDLTGNGVLDVENLYWDVVMVTESEASGEQGPGEDAGKGLFPATMYYVERVLSGLSPESRIEAEIAAALQGTSDAVPFLNTLVSRYKEIPQAAKMQLFDPGVVQMILDPLTPLSLEALQNHVTTMDPDLAVTQFDTPAAPGPLTATNTSPSGPDPDTGQWLYRIALNWQDNADDEEGFLIYRLCYPSIVGTPYQQIAQVGPNVTTYDDDSLSAPTMEESECCYQVTAFRNSRFSVVGQPPAKLESTPSNSACSNYDPNAPPVFIDSDGDGVPDDLDECPLDHSEGAPWTNGCPDDDDDGVPNKDDACKLIWGEKEDGCPLKYQIRWMGMDVLNNSGEYAWPGYDFLGLTGPQFNEIDQYPGEEPYLLFAFVNGMTPKGAKESGTNKWCCGDKVIVPKSGPPVDADGDGYLDNHEPDKDTTGEEFPLNNQAVLESGLPVFPAFSGQYAEIDPDLGMVLTVSLLERDWTMTVTPQQQASAVDAAIKSGSAVIGAVSTCVGSAGFGCLLGIGGAIKTIIDSILGLSNEPDPIEVTDPDDPMGTAVWAVTRSDAAFKTSGNGSYGFWFDMPTTYQKSCLGWDPCPAGAGVIITMRAKQYFCLVREDVPQAEVAGRCGAPSTYSQVLPWPMTVSAP